jgi:tetratricopeptide (TPR) repeat protein
MLATKNWDTIPLSFVLVLCGAILLGGCTPPGARALLDGDRLIHEGKYAEAIEKLKAATQLLPEETQARAWNHLGLAYHQAGQWNDAIAAYQQALKRNPNLATARYNLGCLFLDQNKLPEAVSEFTTFTLLDRNGLDGWLKLGTAQLRSRQWDAAEKSFLSVLQLNAASVEALNGLGLVQLQRKSVPKAFNYFSTALQKQPSYAPALLNLAILSHQYLTNRPMALQRYKAYLELKPPPANGAAVQEIVRRIELELNPPPRPVMTNPPVSPSAIALTPAPLTNRVATPVGSTSPPPATPATQSNLVKIVPPVFIPKTQQVAIAKPDAPPPEKTLPSPQPIAKPTNAIPPTATLLTNLPVTTLATNPPAPDIQKPIEPPPKVEEVKIELEPPPKTALDVAPTLPIASTNLAAKVPDPEPPVRDQSNDEKIPDLVKRVPPAKPGIVDRLNPLNWFRGKNKPDAPASSNEVSASKSPPAPKATSTRTTPEVTSPSDPVPQAITFIRYSYRSPAKPVAGNRTQAEPSFSKGLNAHQERRLASAIEGYREAVRLDPAYYDAFYNLGLAAYEINDLTLSLSAYEYALAVNPASFDARYNFALALQRGNHLQDAANELEKILTSHPEEARVHLALAKLYADYMARLDLARRHYRKVLELEPQHPQASAIRYWLANHP